MSMDTRFDNITLTTTKTVEMDGYKYEVKFYTSKKDVTTYQAVIYKRLEIGTEQLLPHWEHIYNASSNRINGHQSMMKEGFELEVAQVLSKVFDVLFTDLNKQ